MVTKAAYRCSGAKNNLRIVSCLRCISAIEESVMQTLEELSNDLRCMDSNELTAFGQKHRANPEFVEISGSESGMEAQARTEAKRLPNSIVVGFPGETFFRMQKLA